MVAVAGAAVIAAIVVIAGKQALQNLKAQRPGSGLGASVPVKESCLAPLRQSLFVAVLTSAGSTRLIIGGRPVLSADEASRADIALGNIH
jgi:hypothetical protein